MDMAKLVPLAVQLSIFLIVFSLGSKTSIADVTALWRKPFLLARSIFALNIVVPAGVILVVLALDPIPPVKAALLLLAISPVPPILPLKQMKLSSDYTYIYGLLVTTSLLSVFYVPGAVLVMNAVFGQSIAVAPGAVFRIIMISVIVPLVGGMILRSSAPERANAIGAVAGKVGLFMLAVLVLLLLMKSWRPIVSLIGNGTAAIIALVVVLGLAAGHVLGGPDPDDRVALALAGTAHHPGIALVLANALAPGNPAIGAAIILYLLLAAIFTLPYTNWRKRALESARAGTRAPLTTLRRSP